MLFYHQTKKKNLPCILRDGLRCRESSFWKASGGAIYLGASKDMSFGEVTLVVNIPAEWIAQHPVWKLSDWEYWTQTDIPAEFIEVVT